MYEEYEDEELFDAGIPDKIKSINELKEGVREYLDEDVYPDYLDIISRFLKYSPYNCELIHQQMPDASIVAGYVTWRDTYNRHVKKNEKAIWIWAPKKGYGFRQIPVFDISQTEGEELPDSLEHETYTGTEDEYHMLLDSLIEISPVLVSFEYLDSLEYVIFDSDNQEIRIEDELSYKDSAIECLRGICHAVLHNPERPEFFIADIDGASETVEADSVAYIVLSHFGFDTDDICFGYISKWGEDNSASWISRCMSRIQTASFYIIDLLSSELESHQYETEGEVDPEDMYPPGYEEPEPDYSDEEIKAVLQQYDDEVESEILYMDAVSLMNGTEETEPDLNAAIECFRNAAEKGHCGAAEKLLELKNKGKIIDCDNEELLSWNLILAENEDPAAQNTVGYMYARGEGCKVDKKTAFSWFKRAAENGNSYGQSNLALYYYYGTATKVNYRNAAIWAKKSAKQGNKFGQYRLAECYFWGNGLEENNEKAFSWYKKAAKQGDKPSMLRIGTIYEKGYGVKEDMLEAAKWYEKGAEDDDDWYSAAECYYKAEEYDKAIELYEKIADYNDASLKIAEIYFNNKEDKSEAYKWYKTVAGKGFSSAYYRLGMYMSEETSDNHNLEEAAVWFFRCSNSDAEQKYLAMLELAKMYYEGKGVLKSAEIALGYLKVIVDSDANSITKALSAKLAGDTYYNAEEYQKAFSLYNRCIELGGNLINILADTHRNEDEPDQNIVWSKLGIMYESGLGCPINIEKAIEYYGKVLECYSRYRTNAPTTEYYTKKIAELKSKIKNDLFEIIDVGQWTLQRNIRYNIAKGYEEGINMPRDYEKAFEMYSGMAENGHVDALFKVGWFYHKGLAVEKNIVKAVQIYEFCAKKGYPEAAVLLGDMYLKGDEIEADYQKAARYNKGAVNLLKN